VACGASSSGFRPGLSPSPPPPPPSQSVAAVAGGALRARWARSAAAAAAVGTRTTQTGHRAPRRRITGAPGAGATVGSRRCGTAARPWCGALRPYLSISPFLSLSLSLSLSLFSVCVSVSVSPPLFPVSLSPPLSHCEIGTHSYVISYVVREKEGGLGGCYLCLTCSHSLYDSGTLSLLLSLSVTSFYRVRVGGGLVETERERAVKGR
jgi:hypothetical protein